MSETRKGFFEYLQTLPDPAKKRVLIVAAVVAMLIIIYFWLAYFDSLIVAVGQQSAAPIAANRAAPASAAPGPAANIGEHFKGGLAYVYNGFANFFRGIGGMISSEGQYSVQPQQQ